MFPGAPVVADPFFDILLSDVKNARREEEEGVVTLGEIATEIGFENRGTVTDVTVQSPLRGLVRGKYRRYFAPCTIRFRSRTIKTLFLN
jgi:hypothetical protein